jgi:hypothetical protein
MGYNMRINVSLKCSKSKKLVMTKLANKRCTDSRPACKAEMSAPVRLKRGQYELSKATLYNVSHLPHNRLSLERRYTFINPNEF